MSEKLCPNCDRICKLRVYATRQDMTPEQIADAEDTCTQDIPALHEEYARQEAIHNKKSPFTKTQLKSVTGATHGPKSDGSHTS